MKAASVSLEQQKAHLLLRCETERYILSSTCVQLQQSMTWWDMGYTLASAFAPKAKLLLPVVAMVLGSRLGSLGQVGSIVSKLIMGWQFFQKIRSASSSLDLPALFKRLKG
jgi:hypothetical protein